METMAEKFVESLKTISPRSHRSYSAYSSSVKQRIKQAGADWSAELTLSEADDNIRDSFVWACPPETKIIIVEFTAEWKFVAVECFEDSDGSVTPNIHVLKEKLPSEGCQAMQFIRSFWEHDLSWIINYADFRSAIMELARSFSVSERYVFESPEDISGAVADKINTAFLWRGHVTGGAVLWFADGSCAAVQDTYEESGPEQRFLTYAK